MDNNVYVNSYDPPEYDKRAIYRYAGIREGFGGIFDNVDECIAAASPSFTYKVCFRRFEVTESFGALNLGFFTLKGGGVFADYFRDCSHFWVFAATVGLPIDRLIAKYSSTSPIKAILFQALGTLPGISRSGSTIVGGLFSGLDKKAAVRFSFLMSIPAILGALILDIKVMMSTESALPGLLPIAAGMLTAAVSGYLSIKFLLRIVEKSILSYFCYYCAAAGIFAVIWNFI